MEKTMSGINCPESFVVKKTRNIKKIRMEGRGLLCMELFMSMCIKIFPSLNSFREALTLANSSSLGLDPSSSMAYYKS